MGDKFGTSTSAAANTSWNGLFEQVVMDGTNTTTISSVSVSGNAVAFNTDGADTAIIALTATAAISPLDASNFTFASINYIDSTGVSVAGTALTAANDSVNLTGGTGINTITASSIGGLITGAAAADIIVLNAAVAIDKIIFSGGNSLANIAAANGIDQISGFGSTDTLNVAALGDTQANSSVGTIVTAAASKRTMTNNKMEIITTTGTAADITSSGSATLAVADYTAGTLTNLAAFLNEGFQAAVAATTESGGFIINDANTNLSYVYAFDNSTAAKTIIAAELGLVGVIDNGGTDLTAAQILFS